MYETINQMPWRVIYLIGSTDGMMKKKNKKISKIKKKKFNCCNTVPLNTISIG